MFNQNNPCTTTFCFYNFKAGSFLSLNNSVFPQTFRKAALVRSGQKSAQTIWLLLHPLKNGFLHQKVGVAIYFFPFNVPVDW